MALPLWLVLIEVKATAYKALRPKRVPLLDILSVSLLNLPDSLTEYDKYKIICYCLMDNHVHILIKEENKPVGQLIGRINGRYAKYFNKKLRNLV
ncbi:Transposase IS200 like [Clostridium cochlearium]|uniref:Transposase IS200 like n=1 Tax=Clostridium cochlearium TaxID=1494 RepID=A0ABY0QNZ3_CLOCO|nr:transposase [Bacteroidales bacterium MSK.15.36]SDL41076.1 Transposase IS200 like [Clostridium cochlearium]